MTRVERLPSLVEHGLLSDNVCRQRQITGVGIGYEDLKGRRARRTVPCGVGGTLADYVPFYFAPRSPMLNAITRDRVSAAAAQTHEIVYLVTSTQALRAAGLTVVASDRHAMLGFADFTDRDSDLTSDDFIDWPLMMSRYWANTESDPDRRDRRQAECLVHPGVPWDVVAQVCTKDGDTRRRVEEVLSTLGLATPVAVRSNWYF